MCGGVSYIEGEKEQRCYFPNPQARLPVITRHSGVVMVPWGRRRDEKGDLPLGGWARLESIYGGIWNHWQPRPVRLQLQGFMEKDIQGESLWFTLTPGQWVQGLVARQGAELRVYVVTIHPEMPDAVHPRWPRIVSG
jgi:hypothetical protein